MERKKRVESTWTVERRSVARIAFHIDLEACLFPHLSISTLLLTFSSFCSLLSTHPSKPLQFLLHKNNGYGHCLCWLRSPSSVSVFSVPLFSIFRSVSLPSFLQNNHSTKMSRCTQTSKIHRQQEQYQWNHLTLFLSTPIAFRRCPLTWRYLYLMTFSFF